MVATIEQPKYSESNFMPAILPTLASVAGTIALYLPQLKPQHAEILPATIATWIIGAALLVSMRLPPIPEAEEK